MANRWLRDAPALLAVVDDDLACVHLGRGRRARLGLADSHADGSPYPHAQRPIDAALRGGEGQRVDDEVSWHVDGSAVPIEYASTPIREDGRIRARSWCSARSRVARSSKVSERASEEITRLKEQLEQERDYLRDEIASASDFGGIIGASAALSRTLAQIDAVPGTPLRPPRLRRSRP